MNSKQKIVFLIALAWVVCSCEIIKEEDRMIALPVPGTPRTHVLVEFTGFRCVNCPDATEKAESMKAVYGDHLIVVAMHPASNPFTQGLHDYTCPAADNYYRFCGGTAQTSFPAGSIDLQEQENGFLLDPLQWAAGLNKAMTDTLCPNMLLTAQADTLTREVRIMTHPYSEFAREHKLSIWLVEDSVQGVQAMSDGTVNRNYFHRHMLREAWCDIPWGEYTFQLPDICRAKYCSIVAVMQDKNNQTIRQANETKLDVNATADGGN